MQSLTIVSLSFTSLLLHGINGFSMPSYSAGFTSSLSSSSSSAQKDFVSSMFNAPFDQFQRVSIKKKLIEATKNKNEDEILALVNELSKYNPTAIPTLGLLGYGNNDKNDNDTSNDARAPLNGKWKLLYTNARDAEAPARTEKNKEEKFGDEVASGIIVKTGQRINAAKGECINFIQLTEEEITTTEEATEDQRAKKKKPFDEFEITIQMTPLSNTRVRLDFVKGKALNENAPLPFLKEFSFRFPPPSFGDALARLRGLDPSVEPQAYFDILYIDNEIRAHQTGEGKIFVQKRDK